MKWRWIVGALFLCLLLLVVSAIGWRFYLERKYAGRIYDEARAVPSELANEPRVAIVFGASVWRSGQPSPVLKDRVETAVDLYKAGKVQKLLLSGDNRTVDYNEPAAMRQAAMQKGVPEQAIVLDYAGRRTYDTCFRARRIFEVKRAILVTQEFHLPRAIYLCQAFGIDSIGVTAEPNDYGAVNLWWKLRETAASAAAWYDVNISHPTPVLGERIPIKQD
jgi:SanA protein